MRTLPAWILDTAPQSRRGALPDDLGLAAEAAGCPVLTVEHRFEGLDPRIPAFLERHPACLVRGSVGFAAEMRKAFPGLRPGDLHSAGFAPAEWLSAWGDLCLNHPARILSYGEFRRDRAGLEEELGARLFVKPADGGKVLTGLALASGRPLDDAHFSAVGRWSPIPDSFLLVVAPAKEILAEWRLVVVDGRAASASRYVEAGHVALDPGAPEAVLRLAEDAAALWSPAPAFCLDVAATPEGPRLLEPNCFGTSALYACPRGEVASAFAESFPADRPWET